MNLKLDEEMYNHRSLEATISKISAQFPVLLITGPRQVGKTTTLKYLSGTNRTYITLDNVAMATLAKADPKLFLERFPPPLLIDEIQYAPELLREIKIYVDTHKKPGDFWLTGSQQFHLMKGVFESLAGRVGIVKMLGLSLLEMNNNGLDNIPFLPTHAILEKSSKIYKHLGLKELYNSIWRGSFPHVALNRNFDREIFYASYVQSYLTRDIRDLARVGDEAAFLNFLKNVAARTGQMLNLSDLARDCGISPPTAKIWLSLLETSGIIYLLKPYYTNLTKRLIKTPKLYFLDTGLASYLTDWSSPETLESGAMSGAILETFVVQEIIKSYWHDGKEAPLYYYRDKDKKEIDLLIIQDQTIYPLEIKKTSSPSKMSATNFSLLDKLSLAKGEGGIICLSEDIIPLASNLHAIPVSIV